MMGGDDVLASAAASASYNMVLQLMLRLITFVLNAVILRYISRDTLGIVNVRLLLLHMTIVFLSREAFRRASLTADVKKPWRQLINFLWLVVPVGVCCGSLLAVVWMYSLDQPDTTTTPHYKLAVVIYATAALIELLAEPLYISGQILLFVKLKVITEGVSQLLGCILTITLVICCPHWGLIAFSIAQLVISVSYTVMYYVYFLHYMRSGDKTFPFTHISDVLPARTVGKPLISWPLAELTWSFYKQSFLKQLLTEGERYVMTVFGVLNFADQGVYDVVKNLGSLAARFFFLPLEDSGYLFFSQTIQRGVPAKSQDKDSMDLSSGVLHHLLKSVILIGLIIITFGLPYSHLALDLYGGNILSEGTGPRLLQYYCLYTLLLAVNGITECFTFATMAREQVDRYNSKMLVFSAVFLLSAWYLTGPLGSAGFIVANCLNMIARITHSIYYTLGFYTGSKYRPLHDLTPSISTLIALTAAAIISLYSQSVFCCDHGWTYRILHVAIGGVCGIVVLIVIWFNEQNLIAFIKNQYSRRKSDKTIKSE